jgi:hypothetical protein
MIALCHNQIQLSDGDHFLYAVMAPRLRAASRSKEVAQNTLIKITDYEKCIASSSQEVNGVEKGQLYLQIQKISIISQDPGHKFCNPVYYYDVCDDESEEGSSFSSSSSLDESREAAVIVNPHPSTAIVQQSSIDAFMRPANVAAPRRLFVAESQALQELYYCKYQIRDKPIDSKVPATEWEVDTHGVEPGPRCRWIPAAETPANVKDTKHGNADAPFQSATSANSKRPAVASFNAFAASVLPLPLQSKYSIPPSTCGF